MTDRITGPAPGSRVSRHTVTGPAPGLTDTTLHPSKGHDIGNGELSLAAVFSSHMVLQRRAPIAIFGTGTPKQTVTVTLATQNGRGTIHIIHADTTVNVQHQSVSSIIAQDGTWQLSLPALECADPCTLTVTDERNNAISIGDVLIGEVWIASGQSNIEYILRNDAEAARTIPNANDSRIRYINIPKSGVVDDELLQSERESPWQACSPQTCGDMSAIAYYFAARLRTHLDDVPIGIIDCYVGGTSVTCWMSERTLSSSTAGRRYLERYHTAIQGKTDTQMRREMSVWNAAFTTWNNAIERAKAKHPGIGWPELNAQYGECPWPPPMTTFSPYRPTGPYQAMLSRIAPYSVRGALWYQGEDDTAYADDYHTLLSAMIQDWRSIWKTWNHSKLPFLIMQLPRWISKDDAAAHHDDCSWARLRQAQRDVADDMEDAALTIAIDLGEFDNIHPIVKRPFGERLADTALHEIYGIAGIRSDGPRLAHVERDISTDTIHISFDNASSLHFGHYNGDHLGTSLSTIPSGDPYDEPLISSAHNSGFEVLTDDNLGDSMHGDAWTRVPAKIDHNTVILSTPHATSVTAVRYAWRNWGPAPLFNENNLPAEPFTIMRDATCHNVTAMHTQSESHNDMETEPA